MKLLALLAAGLVIAGQGYAAEGFETDMFDTSAGALTITFIGHGTVMFELADGRVVHVDPWTSLADYTALPKADLVLVTHGHGDHLDPAALKIVRTGDTVVVAPPMISGQIDGSVTMDNGDSGEYIGLKIDAVPAYNIEHLRSPGVPYHPKGEGNGYVITFGDTRVYVAGDTENIPEMKNIKDIDIAFLPMNLPYTMTPEMTADAARMFGPKVLYPYHFGETDTSKLAPLLKDSGIEVRIRDMK